MWALTERREKQECDWETKLNSGRAGAQWKPKRSKKTSLVESFKWVLLESQKSESEIVVKVELLGCEPELSLWQASLSWVELLSNESRSRICGVEVSVEPQVFRVWVESIASRVIFDLSTQRQHLTVYYSVCVLLCKYSVTAIKYKSSKILQI